MMLIFDVMLRCCWLPFDAVMMWCWCDMNYLYTAESYENVGLSQEVIRDAHEVV